MGGRDVTHCCSYTQKSPFILYRKRFCMIYIVDYNGYQEVYVPATQSKQTGTLTFILKSTVDRTEPVEVSVTDMNDSDMYYHFNLTFPNKIQEGEYEYKIKKGKNLLGCGLAMVAGDKETNDEYNITVQYEQYESDN